MTTSTKARLYTVMLAAPFLFAASACTDLDEVPVSSITPENFFRNEGEVLSALAGVYAQLRPTLWSYYNLSQVSSDENIVPTRGQDWFDNGVWLELDKHTWAPNSPSGRDNINGAWVDVFTGVVRANVLLENMAGVTIANQEAVEAEIRSLRAFYYYQLMDLFGGVPLVTDTELKTRPRNTRTEIFNFVEAELKEVRGDLPVTRPASEYGRVTRGAADAMLASLYLNAAVFSKETGVSPTAYNSCNTVQIGGVSACQLASNHADSILNSGAYSLATNWHSNFTADNSASPENIFVVNLLNVPGLGTNFLYRALHYNQLSPTPWNGFATIAEVYNAFDPDDERREIFLVGQQINFDNGEQVNDRAGNPLVFTVDIANERAAGEHEGARIAKWPSDPAHRNEDHGNDFAYFRLGEIYLIKAEAQLELGNAAGALALVNQLRARVFEPDEPLGSVDRDAILRERLFELTGEAKRRQDLIRHGRYTMAWRFKPASEPHKVLMPIPQNQIDANPLLQQNPGY
ncbi:MAG: RagB/SusD family nutrient uptake outer membrane protein [Gemmatimonadaceae bacterium]